VLNGSRLAASGTLETAEQTKLGRGCGGRGCHLAASAAVTGSPGIGIGGVMAFSAAVTAAGVVMSRAKSRNKA